MIICRDAAFAYNGSMVVDGLNFQVARGDYLSIVGENGSGKTTLMKGMLGLISPASGSLELSDGLKPSEIGYLPQQNSAAKDFPASVYEVVLSGCLNSRGVLPFYSKKDKQAAQENMEKLGVASLRKKSIRELSGGQQQRVLLARALCATGKVILLDEPVSGLDPLITAELYETIRELGNSMGVTIVMISHDIKSAIEYSSHILHLQNKQLFFGTTNEYKKTAIGKRFLG